MISNNGIFIDSENGLFRKEKISKSNKRTLIKTYRTNKVVSQKGVIVSNPGKNFLVVNYKDFIKWNYKPVECVRGGTLVSEHTDSTILSVGDIVDYTIDPLKNEEEAIGKIVKVYPRKSFISRKSIRGNSEDILGSNIRNVLIFMSVNQPHFNKRFIDRILVASEIGNAKSAICINKIDLDEDLDFLKELNVYKKLRIKIFTISALKKKGLDGLKAYFKNNVTAVVGPSGSGKSSMLNAIFGKEVQKVGELRHKQTKGKHTTSYSTMFFLKEGGAIIDTPGIREFGLYGVDKSEICFFFKEFNKYYDGCKYMPCTHTHEPECKVKEAVDKGWIDEERYISYLNIYDSLE